jgi:hypothetical protein
MKQALHIFKKDAHRFWPEIGACLAFAGAFVCIGSYLWTGRQDAQSTTLAILAGLVGVSIPISWLILITRVIHGERLVGDTQFWITRPYVWNSLLTAKLLFLVVFLYLPFFVAQLSMLAEAGFAPLRYVPGVLFNFLLLTGICVLPLAALATVTSSFARLTLTLLGIFLAIVALLTASAFLDSNSAVLLSGAASVWLSFATLTLVFSAGIVLQYALRRVWLARGVLLALPVMLIAVSFWASKYDKARMDVVYQAAQGLVPIQLAYSPDPKSTETESLPAGPRVRIPVGIRLIESGVAEGYAVIPEAVRAEFTASDGFHWDSGWGGGDGYKFLSGESHFTAHFSMPIWVFSRYQSVPLNVRLSFAITKAQAGRVTSVPMSMERFQVPEFGNCSGQSGWTPQSNSSIGIHCISALSQPQLTYISTYWSDGQCSGEPTAAMNGVLGTAWVGSLDPPLAQPGISPVVELQTSLSNSQIVNTPGGKQRYLCAGTPVTFTQYTRVQRMKTSIDIQGFVLPKMTMQGNMISVSQ